MTMMSGDWVLDATFYRDGGPLTFCPIAEDGDILIGFGYISDRPPGRFVGVIHAGGDAAVEEFCDAHTPLLDALAAEPKAPPA